MSNQKEEFFKKFNEAFATGDVEYLLQCFTEDVKWTMVGSSTIEGIGNMKESLESMRNEHPSELHIEHIITDGKLSSVNGTMKMKDESGQERKYAFCDVCLFNNNDGKIKEMTSYVLEVE